MANSQLTLLEKLKSVSTDRHGGQHVAAAAPVWRVGFPPPGRSHHGFAGPADTYRPKPTIHVQLLDLLLDHDAATAVWTGALDNSLPPAGDYSEALGRYVSLTSRL